MAVIPRLPTLYDEPFSDSSQIPTYLVSQLARTQVTVSLSGDGGDELFGGYNRYFIGRSIWSKVGWLPRVGRQSIARLLYGLAPQTWNKIFSLADPLLPPRLRVQLAGDKLHRLSEMLFAKHPQGVYVTFVSQWRGPGGSVTGGHD